MNLSSPPVAYDQRDQAQVRAAITLADRQSRKKGEDVDCKGARLFLYDSAGQRYSVTVSTSGALSATPA